jgi:hypothetical protein
MNQANRVPKFDAGPQPRRPDHRQTPAPALGQTGDPMKYFAVAILAVALGVAGIVAGEADDSPGLQLIGVILIVGAGALGVRMAQRRR